MKNELLKKCHYIESSRVSGLRGDYYDYCYITPDGDFYAFGQEQGNYAGGIYDFEYEVPNDINTGKCYGPFRKQNIENYLKRFYIKDINYYKKIKKYTIKKYRILYDSIERGIS